jgi:hypothetical protein
MVVETTLPPVPPATVKLSPTEPELLQLKDKMPMYNTATNAMSKSPGTVFFMAYPPKLRSIACLSTTITLAL